MKKINLVQYLVFIMIILLNTDCKKETPLSSPLSNPSPSNTAPKANAGQNIQVLLPVDFCLLSGSASDAESNIKSYTWKKISGPTICILENPDSLVTTVSKLEKGVYEFELTVTDKGGLTGKDTASITVSEIVLNTAPVAHAGGDLLVVLPIDSCWLHGSASDKESNIKSYAWKKISGPTMCILENPDSLKTKVSNLQIGIYYFELTVSDSEGLSGKDTIKVTVKVIVIPVIYNNNEVIFENLNWGTEGLTTTLLWGSAIIIHNVYQYLPAPGTPFTAYIKRDNSTNWDELVMNDSNSYYVTNLLNGNLILWSSYDETDTPDIKLVY